MLTVTPKAIAIAGAIVVTLVTGMTPSLADDSPVHGHGGGQTGGLVNTTITDNGSAGSTQPIHFAGGGAAGDGGGDEGSVDPCRYTPIPAANKAQWAGYDPSKGTLYAVSCPELLNAGTGEPVWVPEGVVFAPVGTAPRVEPPPDPGVLAASVRNTLPLPVPAAAMSPDLPNNVDPHIGLPVTYVNLWVWFWSPPTVWRTFTQSTSLRAVTVNVAAQPVSLSFSPGNGDAAVVCGSAGAPWESGFGNDAPAEHGGCGYVYRAVTRSAAEPITASLSITWRVTWTSNTGGRGELDPLVTSTSTVPFGVEQIETVLK